MKVFDVINYMILCTKFLLTLFVLARSAARDVTARNKTT